MKVICLVVLASTLAACGSLHGGAGSSISSSSNTSTTSSPAAWPPPGEVQIGTIPNEVLNADGFAFYPAPANAQPTVTQEQAESKALAGPNPYASSGQPLAIRHTYLVNELSKGAAPDGYVLAWVVDISPDRPFNPISGGNGFDQSPASTSAEPSAEQDHWAWVGINATNGNAGTSWG